MPCHKLKQKKCKSKFIIPKTKFNTFYTISDGKKKVYTNKEYMGGYGINTIPDPSNISFISVFINGVPQPPSLYKIKKGVLILRSKNIPKKGVPIIIQYLKKHLKKHLKKPIRKGVKTMGDLIKLLVTATATQPTATGTAVSVSFTNIVSRFFSTIPNGGLSVTIFATAFTDDNNVQLGIQGLPNGVPANGYVNIYVEGVLQQGSILTSLIDTTLVLNSTTTPFTAGVPIVLEVVSFENSTTTVTQPTISTPLITVTT